jgi:DNA-binding NtrC family response regulator
MQSGLLVLVDDDKSILEVGSSVLQDAGYRVKTFLAADQALSFLRQNREVDALISDFYMPRMDGLRFLTEVRAHDPSLPFIFLTGFADKSLALRALNLGCSCILEKPFRSEEILHYTQQAIAIRQRDSLSHEILKENDALIELLEAQARTYENRFKQAEQVVASSRTETATHEKELKAILGSIAQSLTIEQRVRSAKALVESLKMRHRELVSNLQRVK